MALIFYILRGETRIKLYRQTIYILKKKDTRGVRIKKTVSLTEVMESHH